MKVTIIFMVIGLFCYDLITGLPKECSVRSGSHGIQKRNAIKDKTKLWPGGNVFYEPPGSNFNVTMQDAITAAIKEFQNNTCLTFTKRTVEANYLYFNLSDACAADIGMQTGMQYVNLEASCAMDKASVEHEVMHTLGFFHQMCVPDRDTYVTIHWENIDPDKKFNFDLCPASEVDYKDYPFDCDSVMMYNHDAFSNNTKDTIVPVNKTQCNPETMGNADKLSPIDIQKIRKLYSCTDKPK